MIASPRRPLVAGLVALGLSLVAAEARADLLPEGFKGVKLSIKVDAELPAGKALVLANTFRGADVLEAGKVSDVEWHPLGGEMRLHLLAADAAAKIGPLREGIERDAIKAIVDGGIGCGDAFPGVRVIPESSPAAEVRWTYRVSVDGEGCKAAQVSMAYLDEGGKSVPGPNGEPVVEDAPSPAPATPPAAEAAPSEAPAVADAAAAAAPAGGDAAQKGGCGCVSAPVAGAEGALLLGLVIVGLRRRPR